VGECEEEEEVLTSFLASFMLLLEEEKDGTVAMGYFPITQSLVLVSLLSSNIRF